MSVKSSQYSKVFIIVIYALLAFLAQFFFPMSLHIVDFDVDICYWIPTEKLFNTFTATLISFLGKHSIIAFGIVIHAFLVVGMNNRSNTSIILHKIFNISALVLQLTLDVTDFFIQLCDAVATILLSKYVGYNSHSHHTDITLSHILLILFVVQLSVAITTQILFPILNFMFLMSLLKLFQNCCECKN